MINRAHLTVEGIKSIREIKSVSFWFTRIAANQSSISALLTNRVGDCFLTVDYSTVFSLAPFVSENIVTIIGLTSNTYTRYLHSIYKRNLHVPSSKKSLIWVYDIRDLSLIVGAPFKTFTSSLLRGRVSQVVNCRVYSTCIPQYECVRKYENADLQKLTILQENQGSSINLRRRFKEYFNVNHLIRNNDLVICAALLKYGYSQFTVEIIEYCDRSNVLLREQYYLDLFKPEYNLLKIAGSNLGYIHTENTLAKMRDSRLNLTEEQKAKVISHLKIHNASSDQVEKSRQRLIDYNKSKGVSVEILDITTNEVSIYSSLREAAYALGCVHGFVEGDGSFIINKDGYLEFRITQSSPDAQILFMIKKELGFGVVRVQDSLLEQVKEYFGAVGSISRSGNMYYYEISSLKSLVNVREHFEEYPLQTTKYVHFKL
ncbi:GIY-YIG endonuclease (mitochondrion) protein [Rutstroemia sp. NJR-2017a BBW]|nr:GIY-YIG endonuclease (mitochondrion) protein [Rutstroemia sp. NJR-2017a BBW]